MQKHTFDFYTFPNDAVQLSIFPQRTINFYLFPICHHPSCNKYISVFAPGTLGILPDMYLVPVSNGLLGDIVSMFQNLGVKYQNNLQHMGFSNITMNYNMGLWGFINETERNQCDTSFSCNYCIRTTKGQVLCVYIFVIVIIICCG